MSSEQQQQEARELETQLAPQHYKLAMRLFGGLKAEVDAGGDDVWELDEIKGCGLSSRADVVEAVASTERSTSSRQGQRPRRVAVKGP
ncbi:hypothetical protein WJX73_010210 [Symbiochloris irregularis]|uniref:Uncharacterized protein n=1 Tax=Symbiochloris irregularis TaxID=706552 RepID=A0AAW1NZS9_9CHLO